MWLLLLLWMWMFLYLSICLQSCVCHLSSTYFSLFPRVVSLYGTLSRFFPWHEITFEREIERERERARRSRTRMLEGRTYTHTHTIGTSHTTLPTNFFTKRTVLYSKSMHNTQNQPSQSALYSLFDYWWPLIAKSTNISLFVIKKGNDLWIDYFLILFWRTPFTKYKQNSRPTCKNQNVHHWGPERPPIAYPNSILININIVNWTVPLL